MKRIILSSLIFITVFASFLFLSSKPEKKINEALTLFLVNDIGGVEEIIFDLEQKYCDFKVTSYKGFLALSKEDFENSKFYFQQALYQLHNDDEMLDLLLGKALACYHLRELDEMKNLLDLAKDIDSKSSEYQFVQSLYEYEVGNFSLFLTHLKDSQKKEKKRNWTKGILEFHFSPSWIDVHEAFALVEMHRFQDARLILERYVGSVHLSKHLSEHAAFYLGYSYLKEAEEFEDSEKQSFLKIALFYLERAGNCYAFHHNITSYLINQTASQLNRDQGLSFFTLVKIFQKSDCKHAIETASFILSKIPFEESKSAFLCQMIREEFSNSHFHKCLVNHLIDQMHAQISLDGKKAISLWHIIQTIDPTLTKNKIQSSIYLLEEKILSLIEKESFDLSESCFYLSFLKVLEPAKEEMNLFACSLLVEGMQYFRKDHEEQKGLNILKIAFQLADYETSLMFEKDVTNFLGALYTHAQESNLVRRLSILHDAFHELNIDFNVSVSEDELANHIADAEFFYHAQDFISAKYHAGWVMKLDPLNEDAIKYVGLSSFHLGNYSDAFECLSKLSQKDGQVKEALALCENYFTNDAFAKVVIPECLEIDCNN